VDDDNVWTEEWDPGEDWSRRGAQSKRLPRGDDLGATVYQLGPCNWVPFHFHHASEESRQVAEGEVVVRFPTGPEGVHGLSNETEMPVRYVMVSTLHSPEVAEYPDIGKITAQARTASETGERLWVIHDLESPVKE
jgi:uncharacterized cupin superfamily protein